MKPSLHAVVATALLVCAATMPGTAAAQTNVSPEMRAKVREVALACWGDIRKLCAGIEQGDGRIAACLMQHEDKLSETCRDKMSSVQTQ